MHQTQKIISALFLLSELVIGALVGNLYIGSYSFWTSTQGVAQFFITVVLLYAAIVFLLGILNLIVIGSNEKRFVIRCIMMSAILGAVGALVFLYLPHNIHKRFDFLGQSPFVIILIGMVVGFNIPVFGKK